MFSFKQTLQTVNKSEGRNTCEYIVIHHTGTGEGTLKGCMDGLLGIRKSKSPVSAHMLIDTDGAAYKLADPRDICWHAGKSEWDGKENLNLYSIGIEIIGPLPGFTLAQKITLKQLVRHLMKAFGIPKEKVIRHKDISKGRKNDVDDSFWNTKYKSWTDYQNSF